MAKLVFGVNLSLDAYVDYEKFAPDPVLFHHWIAQVRSATASIYGRRMAEPAEMGGITLAEIGRPECRSGFRGYRGSDPWAQGPDGGPDRRLRHNPGAESGRQRLVDIDSIIADRSVLARTRFVIPRDAHQGGRA